MNEEKANSLGQEDIEMVEVLKQEVQEMEDEQDMAIGRKQFLKMQLDEEKLIKFFFVF